MKKNSSQVRTEIKGDMDNMAKKSLSKKVEILQTKVDAFPQDVLEPKQVRGVLNTIMEILKDICSELKSCRTGIDNVIENNAQDVRGINTPKKKPERRGRPRKDSRPSPQKKPKYNEESDFSESESEDNFDPDRSDDDDWSAKKKKGTPAKGARGSQRQGKRKSYQENSDEDFDADYEAYKPRPSKRRASGITEKDSEISEEETPKKGKGRPSSKLSNKDGSVVKKKANEEDNEVAGEQKPKKGRGRPPTKPNDAGAKKAKEESDGKPKKGRGRPPKSKGITGTKKEEIGEDEGSDVEIKKVVKRKENEEASEKIDREDETPTKKVKNEDSKHEDEGELPEKKADIENEDEDETPEGGNKAESENEDEGDMEEKGKDFGEKNEKSVLNNARDDDGNH